MKSFIRYWLPVIVYAGIIFYFSSLTQPIPAISIFPHMDKVMHFFEFAFLGILLRRALKGASLPYFQIHSFSWTVIFGVMYAMSDEFHQSFVAGREVTFWDLLSDTIGILASLWINIDGR